MSTEELLTNAICSLADAEKSIKKVSYPDAILNIMAIDLDSVKKKLEVYLQYHKQFQ